MELGSRGHETNGIGNKEAVNLKSESKGSSVPQSSQISSEKIMTPSTNVTQVLEKNEPSINSASFNLNASALPTANFSFPPLTRDLNSVPSEAEFLADTVDATNNPQDQVLSINEQGAVFDDMVIVADGMVTSAPAPAPFSGEKEVKATEQFHTSSERLQVSASVLSLTISETTTTEAKDVSKSECLQGEADKKKDAAVIAHQSEALLMKVEEKGKAAREYTLRKAGVGSNDVNEKDIQSIKGQKVKKKFGKKSYTGVVVDYDPETKWFKVAYEDGDQEELEFFEVKAILATSDSTPTPKKRPRTEGSANEERQKSSKKSKKSEAKTPKISPGSVKSLRSKGKMATPKHKPPQKRKSKTTNSSSSKKKSRSPSSAKKRKYTKRKSEGDNSAEPKAKRLKGAAKSGISLETGASGDAFVGKHVKKDFDGKLYNGIVVKFDRKTQYYKIKYEDGDKEDLELHELQPILIQETQEHQKAIAQKNRDLKPAPTKGKRGLQPVSMPVCEQEKHEIQPVPEQEKREIQPVMEQKEREVQLLEPEDCNIQSILEEVKHELQPISEQERDEFQPVFVQEKNELQPPLLPQDKDNPESVMVQEKHVLEVGSFQQKLSIEATETSSQPVETQLSLAS